MHDPLTYRHPRTVREAFPDDDDDTAPRAPDEGWEPLATVAVYLAGAGISITVGVLLWQALRGGVQ